MLRHGFVLWLYIESKMKMNIIETKMRFSPLKLSFKVNRNRVRSDYCFDLPFCLFIIRNLCRSRRFLNKLYSTIVYRPPQETTLLL